MFENLNWWEFLALLLLALLIFGDRLPKVISDGLRMLRSVRAMARNATGDLSRELGTDIQLEDLHPKTFIRKHLLSEADEEALRNPLRGVYEDLRSDLKGVESELRDVADGINGARSGKGSAAGNGSGDGKPGSGGGPDSTAAVARTRAYDDDAT